MVMVVMVVALLMLVGVGDDDGDCGEVWVQSGTLQHTVNASTITMYHTRNVMWRLRAK